MTASHIALELVSPSHTRCQPTPYTHLRILAFKLINRVPSNKPGEVFPLQSIKTMTRKSTKKHLVLKWREVHETNSLTPSA